jgi:hypothetical protein
VREGQDQEEEEMGPRVAEILVSTGEAGNRLRWESIKGVQIVRETEGISFQGPGDDEMKEQQRVDPELAWVVRWRETPCGSLKFISQVRLLWSVLTVKCLPNK